MNRIYLLLFFLFCTKTDVFAQDFMMQGWYWNYPRLGCEGYFGPNWASNLNGKVSDLENAGFTYLWLPPTSRSASGNCSMGYDPKDLYDNGGYGQGATRFGTESQLNTLLSSLDAAGIKSVADVVYNHRDGGDWQENPAVRDYIMNYPNNSNCSGGITPYPVNGKVRYILELGGSSGNEAGDYYLKLASASGQGGFNGKTYKISAFTNQVGGNGVIENEDEPNGGGDCGEGSKTLNLGTEVHGVEDVTGGCNTDEYKITIAASDYDAAGDFLYIYLEERYGDGSSMDIRPYGLYSTHSSADIIGNLQVQTRTDFTNMPSGQGGMTWWNFKPASVPNTGGFATCMSGEWDFPYFYYDVEEDQTATADAYKFFTEWLWEDKGFRGFRLDAVKHFNPYLLAQVMNHMDYLGHHPGMVVGEHFTSDAGVLNGWVNDVANNMNASAKANINIRAFDFELREKIKNVCDNGHDPRDLFNTGMVNGGGGTGFNAVTFINNHDFRDAFQPVWNLTNLAYAYILTNNQIGVPSVYYPDYFGDAVPNHPGVFLKDEIDALMQVHQDYIFGSPWIDYLNNFNNPYYSFMTSGEANRTMIYQMAGGVAGKDVIVAINFSGQSLDIYQQINMTNVSAGETFNEVLSRSNSPSMTLTTNNEVHIQLPANSYSVWVQGAVLPAELTEFTAKLQGNQAKLNWTTDIEEGLSGFAIERSDDGQIFEKVDFINSKGSSSSYQYLDRKVVDGKAYYRLKMIDNDGTFEYSAIRVVEYQKAIRDIAIAPNPAQAEAILSFQNIAEKPLQIQITNINGQVVTELNQSFESGAQSIRLDLKGFASGVYFVNLVSESGQIFIKKLIVK